MDADKTKSTAIEGRLAIRYVTKLHRVFDELFFIGRLHQWAVGQIIRALGNFRGLPTYVGRVNGLRVPDQSRPMRHFRRIQCDSGATHHATGQHGSKPYREV